MPQIKEEDLIKLYSDIDKLEEQRKELQDGYVDLKLKSNKITKRNKKSRWILFLLLVLFIGSIAFFYWNHLNTTKTIEKTNAQKIALLDSIQKISAKIPNKNIAEVIYSIQIGIFKDININFNEEETVNFAEVKTDTGSAYLIGSFLSYKTASEFKNELKKIGLKDIFLVAYDKNKERIGIREALVLSNEEEFLED